MIKTFNEGNGRWLVWNKENGKEAEIVRITDYPRYRVDFEGKTVDTMITNWTRAKAVARGLVK